MLCAVWPPRQAAGACSRVSGTLRYNKPATGAQATQMLGRRVSGSWVSDRDGAPEYDCSGGHCGHAAGSTRFLRRCTVEMRNLEALANVEDQIGNCGIWCGS